MFSLVEALWLSSSQQLLIYLDFQSLDSEQRYTWYGELLPETPTANYIVYQGFYYMILTTPTSKEDIFPNTDP